MTKIETVYRCLRVPLGGLLMVGIVCVLEARADSPLQPCIKNKIEDQECVIELYKSADGKSVLVNPPDVALYSGMKIQWHRTDTPSPPARPDFAVDFDVDCTPFGDTKFTQASPETHPADLLSASQFERCEYRVTIDGITSDPHIIVVGGGGDDSGDRQKKHRDDKHK